MSDKYSHLRLASKQPGDDVNFATVSDRMHFIVTDAAKPYRIGDTTKGLQNRAQAALGGPKMWRIKSAWWRDGSHAWSAQAAWDFERRYQALLSRREREVQHERAVEAIIQSTIEPEYVRLAREDFDDLVNRIAALEETLRFRT